MSNIEAERAQREAYLRNLAADIVKMLPTDPAEVRDVLGFVTKFLTMAGGPPPRERPDDDPQPPAA